MENCIDILDWLGSDVSGNMLVHLDDPGDLVRASAVSRSWRHFVIGAGFCKKLCERKFPEVACFRHVEINSLTKHLGVGSSTYPEWENMEREHRAYACLAQDIMSPATENGCISHSISASSTDNYPEESIENTLFPDQIVGGLPSYWSSEGHGNPDIPETLTYKLSSKLCVVHEIKIQPFEAYFQLGHPIYSSKAVRFKIGYSRAPPGTRSHVLDESVHTDEPAEDNYAWTYVSPEFPMVQDKSLQTFKLPRPVLCIGGILQIELLGRVQTQDSDGLYYICVRHVEVVGRPLSTVFDIDTLDTTGQFILKYDPNAQNPTSPQCSTTDEETETSGWHTFAARIRLMRGGMGWNRTILDTLLRSVAVPEDDESEEDDIIL